MPWPDRKAVLVPVDDSDESLDGIVEALTMVAAPSDVHVIHVLPSDETQSELMRAAFDAGAASAEAVFRRRVDEIQADVQVIVRTGDPGDVIVAAAQELDCDVIVIRSHARSSVKRFFLGSVTDRVLRRATCPVHVLPGFHEPRA